ncbi:hypothetical protein [Streptomyces sp. SYP-A7185]|uniref:hypothetical protein n=1 Tax=Streptomyces sp. SYP-A7185 TaxID=3040076 RepID=UPI0038F61C76
MLFFRHLLEERGIRSHEEFLPPYRKAAERLQLTHAQVDPAPKTFQGWLYDGRKPNRVFRPVIVEMLGYSIEDLWTEVPAGTEPTFVPLASTPLTERHAEPGMALNEMQRMGAMAARRAKEFVLGADRDKVGDDTLGFLNEEVARLVSAYPRDPLATIWQDLLSAQDDAFRILEGGRTRPTQLRDLNFNAGVLSFLIAKGFHDMEDPHQAMMMTRVAGYCAKESEHLGLIALVDGLKSLIAYWAGKTGDALHYARRGSDIAEPLNGTVGLWLLGLQSRAAAVLGDTQTVAAANQEATERREQVVPDELDALGGLLTYAIEKQNYYIVESGALLGEGGVEFTTQAELAVHGLSDPTSPNWAFADLAGAQCNLALIRLHSGELEGAAQSIRPVLDLPSTHRNNGIIVSAQRVHSALTNGPLSTGIAARDLREELEQFPARRPALPR